MNLINIITTNKITMTNDNLFFNISNLLFGLVDVLFVLIPILLCVAFMTIIERKQLASFQRRVGPNTVGWYGVLQPLICLHKSGIFIKINLDNIKIS